MMRRLLPVVAAAAVVAASAATAHADTAPPITRLAVTQDKTTATAAIGGPVSFTTTIRNTGAEPLRRLVAHLNILSLDPGVYVDPEDWSSHRTQYIDNIPAGASTRLSWTVHAVNDGRFVVYVALATAGAGSPVMAGPGLRADVSTQQKLNAAGVLPTAVTTSGVVLSLLILARTRRRRLA